MMGRCDRAWVNGFERRVAAAIERLKRGGYVPVTSLGPPPQGEPALAPASPPRCYQCGTTTEVSVANIDISGGYARHHHLCLTCRVALGALITLFLNGSCFTIRPGPYTLTPGPYEPILHAWVDP